jgi:hypothetical protein
MKYAILLLCIMIQLVPAKDSPSVRLGMSFIVSFPSMDDEKDFADMTTASGLDFELGSTAWGGNLEVLGDIGDRFRIRGGIGVSRLHGAYTEGYDPLSYVLVGLFTAGLGFFLPQSEDVIDLNDEAVSVEAQAYYIFSRSSGVSLSAGIGPVFTFASRKLDSPNTVTKGDGTGFGMVASLRLDQESVLELGCLPLMFGLEAGYKLNSVDIDEEAAENFQLDFSGPFLKAGTYIGL